MTFRKYDPLPEERAGAAAAYYDAGQSASYTTPANAAIQKDLTRHALALLRFGVTPVAAAHRDDGGVNDEEEQEEEAPWLLLDLGAGSGLSTLAANDWLREHGLLGFTLAFDISASMLSLTASGADGAERLAHTDGESRELPLSVQRAEFFRGNAAQTLPLRAGVFRAAIGISMLQWLTREGLETCFVSLYAQLARAGSGGGRAVFQVYPPSPEYVELMEQTARSAGFAYAEVFVSFPHATTAKKWFFCVAAGGASSSSGDNSNNKSTAATSSDSTLCLFGRRFGRKCAWHLLRHGESGASTAKLRERLGKEHVKIAWHVWRKFRRAVAAEAQEAPVHAKAKRSLALWASDELIGEALQSAFVPPPAVGGVDPARALEDYETRAKAVTYEALVARTDEVVAIVHSAYTDAVHIERAESPVSQLQQQP